MGYGRESETKAEEILGASNTLQKSESHLLFSPRVGRQSFIRCKGIEQCKRDWSNSGAKQDFSQLYAGEILALGWENNGLAPKFHQSRLQ